MKRVQVSVEKPFGDRGHGSSDDVVAELTRRTMLDLLSSMQEVSVSKVPLPMPFSLFRTDHRLLFSKPVNLPGYQ